MSAPTSPLLSDRFAVALLMTATLTTMANAAISPALPGLEARFAAHPNAALLTRMLVPAPSLAVVLFAGCAGMLADRADKRSMLLWGVVLFAVAGSAGLVLSSLPAILISRLALGIAVALIITSQTALIADYFEGPKRSRLLGLQISARNIGGFVSITLAGFLALISPIHVFAIHAVALLMLPYLWSALHDPHRRAADPVPSTLGDASKSGLGAGLWAMAALQFLTTLFFFTMPTQLPFFIATFDVTNTALIGSVMGALTLAGALVATRYGRLRTRFGHTGLFALGFGLMAMGMLTLSRASGLGGIFAGAILVGLGFATVSPNFNDIALKSAPTARRGRAAGIMTTSVFLGQIMSPLATLPVIRSLDYPGLFLAIATLLSFAALIALTRRLVEIYVPDRV